MTVGSRGLMLDAGQQIGQPGLAVRRRRLDVQQPRQPARELELLLQARDMRARGGLPVPLPVQPDEHIALGQVLLVHLPRRVRPGAQFEHHRGEPQRRDRARDSSPLLGQLAQRGTHEHPHTAVRSPDDRLIRRTRAGRPPLIRAHHASLQPATPASNPNRHPTPQPAPAVPAGQVLNAPQPGQHHRLPIQRRLQPPLRDTRAGLRTWSMPCITL